ncbi:Glyco hydro 56, Piwi, PAZ and/or DUF1785 domain containing protein [Asbolus verrucosus]|uniref:Glyco hydro 56, Piwi, PAZ and/or DUF1785 domain containing protein n=1 Tax=Asbolus verrucosus TaxID=1661398 RepID=A0A482V7V2_ASBVE|nr:Glyco hydro 56, Piwi, PAZ and/or DUF1785 domain containing protein [Asbolus verrucosus]
MECELRDIVLETHRISFLNNNKLVYFFAKAIANHLPFSVMSALFFVFLLLRFLLMMEEGDSDSNHILQRNPPKKTSYYWNVPTFQCDWHKLNFTGLAEKFGIIQNENDRFRGDEIVILYDPGSFPAILKDNTKTIRRNGGVPQEGNLTLHLTLFEEMVNELIPDDEFSGLGIIDFESWRPIYRQNFGTLAPYKELSVEIERQAHPFWPKVLLEKEAARRFEFHARKFMEETIVLAQQLRANATWGYYAYPYCFNMSPNNMKMACPNEVLKENDRIDWLFNASDNLHPSLYLSGGRLTPKEKMQMIEGRVNEAHRVAAYVKTKTHEPKIVPYFWYKYHGGQTFLSKEDVFNSFLTLSTLDVDGVVIWGSSNDVNTKAKCLELYEYVDNVLGPGLDAGERRPMPLKNNPPHPKPLSKNQPLFNSNRLKNEMFKNNPNKKSKVQWSNNLRPGHLHYKDVQNKNQELRKPRKNLDQLQQAVADEYTKREGQVWPKSNLDLNQPGGNPNRFRNQAKQEERRPGPGREEPEPPIPGPSSPLSEVESQPGPKLTMAEKEKQTPFKPGTLGRKITIETNHLQLNLGSLRRVYRYDVTVDPDRPKKMLRVAMELFRKAHYPNNHPSYDGQKLLFSAKKLPFKDDTITGCVNLKDDNDGDKEFKITLKLTGIVDLSSLNNLLQKNVNQDEAFQCVEIVFRQAYTSSFISVGRRFFASTNGNYSVGAGAEMYLGGYQAAVKGWTTLLNVDVTHKAFTTAISIKDLILEMFNRPPMTEQDLAAGLKRWQIESLSKYLEGLKIVYQIPNHPGSKKIYRVNDLQQPPSQATFTHNDQSITVENYFRTKWHYNLKYPRLPTLWVGNKNSRILLPLECCALQEGQPIDGSKMTDNQTAQMIRHAATSTTERKRKIQNIIEKAGYNRNPCINEFGFSISDKFQKVDARILQPPALQYSGGTVAPAKGTWKGRRFIIGAQVQKWTIVGVDVQRARVIEGVNELARMIEDFGRSSGMIFSKPEPFDFINADYRTLFRYLDSKKTFDLIIVVVSPFNKNVYYQVKQAAELSVGCLTQCVKVDTLRKLRQSTIENILLKINCKLNGTSHTLCDLNLVSAEPCMVMGADVTHPSPEARTIPSVVAVTASHDLTATNYNVCVGIQEPRTKMSEMIQDLENITLTKLKRFVAKTNKEPARIYFFRDGVSDGEFERVKQVEIRAVQKACDAFRRGYRPKITFVVVQKRHHTRFFPLDRGDSEDKNFNVSPGTCVDKTITDPSIQNFYLVSHASIQGVARPTKYCTLYDDNKLTNDDLQKLTYYLCHVFTRCNRAVSYPAPTYYAHLAADRAKGYLHGKNINMDRLDGNLVKIKDSFAAKNPMFFS